jgi:hypothetical protein
MSGWMRYPDRLAHLVATAVPITDGEYPRRIGTLWRTRCSRELRMFFNRPVSAVGVDPIELRAETPRGWCSKCAYLAAFEALILQERDYSAFVQAVQNGLYPLLALRPRP